MTPVTPDDNSLWHYFIETVLGLTVARYEWLRRQTWKTLATQAYVMAALEKHKETDMRDDDVLIEKAVKPLRESQEHLHEDLKEIKGDIKTLLRAVGRLEGE